MINVEQAVKWRPQAVESDTDVRLSYRCPDCHRENTIHLQPPPWSSPVLAEDEALAAPNGEHPDTSPAVAAMNRFEVRRAAGQVEHEDQDRIVTQLWCHACGKGAEVTVSRSA